MFILSLTSASIYNSAPVLNSQTQVHIMEDSGNLYNLFIRYLSYGSQSYIDFIENFYSSLLIFIISN